ncbi:MAG: malonate-semialdehyde dehydrogenase (acetylating) / methylmalonate-semialdehyde dehydrogenase, partial [Gaiellales bacterium]|nr:malonate-semialdehyde dehydrogenase (acetylating) / methylmalonate-semialdehyde dehydrogenase [Gaiellales bacterium]
MSSSTVEQRSAPTTAHVLKNYVGGAWVAPSAPVGSREIVNPATGETIATVPLSGAADVDAAVAAAREAFPGWRSTPSIERARKLFTLREKLLANSD